MASSATSTLARLKTAASQVIQGLIENKGCCQEDPDLQEVRRTHEAGLTSIRKLGVRTNSDTPDQVKTGHQVRC